MLMVVRVIWMIAGAVIVIMAVMRMVAAVVMVVPVVMAMIVLPADSVSASVSVTESVIMAVAVGLRAAAAFGLHIGPAFRIERRLERDHPSPKTLDHLLDDRVAADAQRFWHDLGRQMAVAEVPGDTGQRQWVGCPDFRQRFGLGDHLHHAPVLKPQSIAAAQHRRFRKIEEEFEPVDARHGDTPAIPSVEVQYDRVRRSARPMAGRDDFVSAQHLYTFRLGRPRHWESRTAATEFEREAKQTPAGL